MGWDVRSGLPLDGRNTRLASQLVRSTVWASFPGYLGQEPGSVRGVMGAFLALHDREQAWPEDGSLGGTATGVSSWDGT